MGNLPMQAQVPKLPDRNLGITEVELESTAGE